MPVEQRGERRVKLAAGQGQNFTSGLLRRPRLLVAPAADQSVEHIRDGHAGGKAVDLIALQSQRIAASVIPFVVLLGDDGGNLHDLSGRVFQQLVAIARMKLDLLEFPGGQARGLLQNVLGHLQLSHIVKHTGDADLPALLPREAQRLAQDPGIRGYPLDMVARLAAPGLHHLGQRVDQGLLLVVELVVVADQIADQPLQLIGDAEADHGDGDQLDGAGQHAV